MADQIKLVRQRSRFKKKPEITNRQIK